MYIIRLTLIFLLTFFSFSCLKNSSKTSSYGSAASIQYYGFAMLKSNNNYICIFKCSFLSARGCQGYYIETSKSGLDEQTLNMIKGTSSDSEDPNKYDTLLNTAKSLIDLATKKRLTSGYCSIASYYERGSWPQKASLLTVKSSIPSKKTSDEESSSGDDTWKEYEYNKAGKKTPILYNAKDGIFVIRTKDLEKTDYAHAQDACNNLSLELLKGNDVLDYIEKYDSKANVFTNIDDCVWKDNTTCISMASDLEVSTDVTSSHQFICHAPVSSFLEVKQYTN